MLTLLSSTSMSPTLILCIGLYRVYLSSGPMLPTWKASFKSATSKSATCSYLSMFLIGSKPNLPRPYVNGVSGYIALCSVLFTWYTFIISFALYCLIVIYIIRSACSDVNRNLAKRSKKIPLVKVEGTTLPGGGSN